MQFGVGAVVAVRVGTARVVAAHFGEAAVGVGEPAEVVYAWEAGDALPSGRAVVQPVVSRLWHASAYASATFQDGTVDAPLTTRLEDDETAVIIHGPLENKFPGSKTPSGYQITLAADVGAAPDGGDSQQCNISSTDDDIHLVYGGPVLGEREAGDYSWAVLKQIAGEITKVMVRNQGPPSGHANIGVDLAAGTLATIVGEGALPSDYGIHALPDGWYLVWMHQPDDWPESLQVWPLLAFNDLTFPGTVGHGFRLWQMGIGAHHPMNLVALENTGSTATVAATELTADVSAEPIGGAWRLKWRDRGVPSYAVFSREISAGLGLLVTVGGGMVTAAWNDPGECEAAIGLPVVADDYNDVVVSVEDGGELKIAKAEWPIMATDLVGTLRQPVTERWGRAGSTYLEGALVSVKAWDAALTDAEIIAEIGATGAEVGNLSHFAVLSNIRTGVDEFDGEYVPAIRFRAPKSGTVTGFRTSFVNRETGAGSYANGDGGDILCALQRCGADGFGDGDTLTSCHHLLGNVPENDVDRAVEAKVWDDPVTLVKGQLYWLQFNNVAADSEANYVSVDFGRRQRHTVESAWYTDLDCQGFWRYDNGPWRSSDGSSPGGSFQDNNLEPILQLHWQDGSVTSHPGGYVEPGAPWRADNPLGTVDGIIGGLRRSRQTWTMEATIVADQLRLYAGRAWDDEGTDPLQILVKQGATLLETLSIPAASIPFEPDPSQTYTGSAQGVYTVGGGFVAVAFASPRTFTEGVEYTFELTAASGTNYRSTPQLRALNFDFADVGMIVGSAQYSTNGGSSWADWMYGSAPNPDFNLPLRLRKVG